MSHKLALSAGFLAVVAVATPHLGAVVSPVGRANAAPPVQIVTSSASAPAFVAPTPVPSPAAPAGDIAPAYGAAAASGEVYGDPKTPDFDPEHPPADMGEPG